LRKDGKLSFGRKTIAMADGAWKLTLNAEGRFSGPSAGPGPPSHLLWSGNGLAACFLLPVTLQGERKDYVHPGKACVRRRAWRQRTCPQLVADKSLQRGVSAVPPTQEKKKSCQAWLPQRANRRQLGKTDRPSHP
jgi:hypothetical protein